MAFDVRPADVEELGAGDPVVVAVENARRKALAVLRAGPVAGIGDSGGGAPESSEPAPPARSASPSSMPVVGVDTVVAIDGGIYGKPVDAASARTTLEVLSGRTHAVVSGICVAQGDDVRTAHTTTRVTFRPLGPATLDWYLATGEWEGRAGGYAIQGKGAALVAGIEGDYLNVVGLPVPALLDLLPGILHEAS